MMSDKCGRDVWYDEIYMVLPSWLMEKSSKNYGRSGLDQKGLFPRKIVSMTDQHPISL